MAPRSARSFLMYLVGVGHREQGNPAGGAFLARVKPSDVQRLGGAAGAVNGGCEAQRMRHTLCAGERRHAAALPTLVARCNGGVPHKQNGTCGPS